MCLGGEPRVRLRKGGVETCSFSFVTQEREVKNTPLLTGPTVHQALSLDASTETLAGAWGRGGSCGVWRQYLCLDPEGLIGQCRVERGRVKCLGAAEGRRDTG